MSCVDGGLHCPVSKFSCLLCSVCYSASPVCSEETWFLALPCRWQPFLLIKGATPRGGTTIEKVGYKTILRAERAEKKWICTSHLRHSREKIQHKIRKEIYQAISSIFGHLDQQATFADVHLIFARPHMIAFLR